MNFTTPHRHDVRIYAEDVDFVGIVYHANYLCYLERARTELLRHNNWTLSTLMELDILFAIKELQINYVYPAKLDDVLTITSQIKETRKCSLRFEQSVINQSGTLICEANIQVVCVDRNLKLQRLPNLDK